MPHKRVAQMTDEEKTRALLRLESVKLEVVLPDGARRRLRGPRVHAGIGRSLDEAAAALVDSKRAGVRTGERAERGTRPRGLAEVA